MLQQMIKHWRDYSICYRPEVAGDIVLSCPSEGCYAMVNFEIASCSIFRDDQEKNFLTLKLAVALTPLVADRK